MLRPLATVLAVLAFAAPAIATTTLYTPPLKRPSIAGGDATCHAANVGKKPISVTIDVVDGAANVVNTYTETIDPGHVSGGPSVYFVSSPGYCRFTFSGGKKDIRGSFISVGPPPDLSTLDVVPAQ